MYLTSLSPPVKYFPGHSKAMLHLWMLLVIYFSCPSCCLICSLQHCGYMLGKGWPLGSLVCDVFLCLCHFPMS